MKPRDKADLFRELAKLVQADFHLDRSLELLLNQRPKAATARLLQGWKAGLASGLGVAEAARLAGGRVLSTLDLALISAGEHSGRLAQSLALLRRYYEGLAESLRKTRSAMIYPLVLLHLGIVLPEIPRAVAGGGDSPILVSIGGKLALVWGALLVLRFLWRRLAAAAESSAPLDRMLGWLPLVGKVRRHWALARFTQVAHSAMLAAVRPQELLRLAGGASGSGQFKVGAEHAAGRVAAGQPFAISLREGGGFPRDFLDSLETAEESGTLDHELERWANLENSQAHEAMDQTAVWAPRIAYALIVIYVVRQIFGMMADIYGPLLRSADLL